jgi:hypothetical protein
MDSFDWRNYFKSLLLIMNKFSMKGFIMGFGFQHAGQDETDDDHENGDQGEDEAF